LELTISIQLFKIVGPKVITEYITHGQCDARLTVSFPAKQYCYYSLDGRAYSVLFSLRVEG